MIMETISFTLIRMVEIIEMPFKKIEEEIPFSIYYSALRKRFRIAVNKYQVFILKLVKA